MVATSETELSDELSRSVAALIREPGPGCRQLDFQLTPTSERMV